MQTDYAVPNNELLAQVHTFGSYILANTIGISMMFPGTFFSAHNPALVDGSFSRRCKHFLVGCMCAYALCSCLNLLHIPAPTMPVPFGGVSGVQI
jgi:hypothetical protein